MRRAGRWRSWVAIRLSKAIPEDAVYGGGVVRVGVVFVCVVGQGQNVAGTWDFDAFACTYD